jgi:prepilin-type N-terminal cleavage/methylation domain-containing protein
MQNVLKKTNKKGFTLVELVIVIAILAILAAIAIPTVSSVIDTANLNVDKANAQTVELAIKSAQAEVTAKIWTPTTTPLQVGEALTHEGITGLPTPRITGSSYRSINGKVSLSNNKPEGKPFTSTSDVATVLSNTDAEPAS